MTTKEELVENKSVTISKEDILNAISNMSVLELADLVKALEDKFGIKAAAMPVAGAVAPAAVQTTQQAKQPEEEKTEFTVTLTEAGTEKIKVIKEIRAITNLGLKEAKELVEGAPKVVKEGVSKEDAAKIKQQLEAVGAKVEIK
jgi:large subunit ribosomal protein L7/L12